MMNANLKALCDVLVSDIEKAHTSVITDQEAEHLAAKFLHAELAMIRELMATDLDFRMKKCHTKAVKAAVYMEAATKDGKKPPDSFLAATVDLSEDVAKEQKATDEAEIEKESMAHYCNVFREAHIYFRQLAKVPFGS